ncbi:MAG TPA: nuclear transport factor 2 family protein [Chryseolinea sp.]|nr:nuclear transport factor 2 family protein [Chryseolinea sp.]
MKALISILCCVAISGNINVHAQDEKKEVLAISQQFFSALEKGDTAALRSLFLDDALNYFVQERDTKVRTGSRSPKSFKADKDRVVRERFIKDGVNVMVHNRIAVVWGSYNLWINDKFSHCGVDAFTLLKTEAGWKISSLSYSMETEGCQEK